MARETQWRRNIFTADVSNEGYGGAEITQIQPGETVLRTYWGVQFVNVAGSTDTYPPGSSLTAAAIWWAASGLSSGDIASPISQGGEDYLDWRFLPWRGNIATSTNVDWLLSADIAEQDVRAMRANQGDADMALYFVWETGIAPNNPVALTYTVSGYINCLVGLAS